MPTKESSTSQKANLARIRDNQRRSRARRKEYLQELEAKWRVCEQLGVEASAEMQAAARKVLDENKRLRTLLKRKGVSDEEIDSFAITASMSASTATPPGSPGPADRPSPAPSSQLAKMLVNRKPISSLGRSNAMAMARSTPEPAVDISPPQIPQPASTSLSIQPPSAQLTPTVPFANLSPSPMISSTVSTPTTMLSPEMFSASPAPPASDPGDYSHLPPAYPFSSSLDNSWQAYHSPVSATSVPDFGYTSCVDAANIIRTMRADGGVDHDGDLGCTNLGAECKADNMAPFNPLDRYAHVPQPVLWRGTA